MNPEYSPDIVLEHIVHVVRGNIRQTKTVQAVLDRLMAVMQLFITARDRCVWYVSTSQCVS